MLLSSPFRTTNQSIGFHANKTLPYRRAARHLYPEQTPYVRRTNEGIVFDNHDPPLHIFVESFIHEGMKCLCRVLVIILSYRDDGTTQARFSVHMRWIFLGPNPHSSLTSFLNWHGAVLARKVQMENADAKRPVAKSEI